MRSAGASGRSLNREIVHRLERTFEETEPHVVTRKGGGEYSMPRKYRRPAVGVGLVAAVAVLLALVAGSSGGHVAARKSPKLFGDPDRASVRNRATPGLSREGARRISELAAEQAADRAFPLATVPFGFRKNALDFFTGNIARRGNDDNGHGWQLAGPTTGLYPAVLNRSNADYAASGRVTAMAIDSSCTTSGCRLWTAAAGGGVWRTDNALAAHPDWTFVSGGFATNAIGSLTFDAASGTLYAGTGEPNSSADSEAGVGVYKSNDGGRSWSLLRGSPAIGSGNAIASIAVDPRNQNTLYVATTLAARGVSGNSGGAVLDPNAPAPGVYKSSDGGRSFTLVRDDSAGPWGMSKVEVDPTNGDVYAAAEGEGIYRSKDGGATWELVFATVDQTGVGRTEFALTTKNGHTRIYVGDGGDETGNATPDHASPESTSGVYRADSIDTKSATDLAGATGTNPGYVSLTSFNRRDPGYLTYDYCWVQCSYDNAVVTPAGSPDTVYVLGAYNYDTPVRNNGRTVLLSTDGGTHWYDQTKDVPTSDGVQNGIHPDEHALVVNPSNPLQFFEGSDGGVVRSSGLLADGTADCDQRGLNPASPSYAACQNALAQVPTRIDSLNVGLSTLQFGTVSVDPRDPAHLQGGTQDNGTFEGRAGDATWPQTMYGDGGQSGFDSANPALRFNNFFLQYTDSNFQGGDPTAWVVTSGPLFASQETSAFYKPMINDPKVGGSIYLGLQHVWRTKDWGGNQGDLEANCSEFTTPGDEPTCGDWVALGDPSGKGGDATAGDLTGPAYGTDKHFGNDYVVRVARAASDSSTLWAATRRGRVFISTNADAANTGDVTFTRVDTAAQPQRFVSGVVIDPANRYHAYVSFGGYNAATPDQPGHVFEVLYNPATKSATWTALDRGSGPLGDLPVTDLALDDQTGRLYAGTDFGVLTQAGRSGSWSPAAAGMPVVEISGLTLDSQNRVLYAATHGRAIWSLQLRKGDGDNRGDGKKKSR